MKQRLVFAFGFLVLAGLVGLACWLASQGKDYYPLVTAVIGVIGPLLAVVVAGLVLRFNIRSQSNPLRVELYKRQAEALTCLYEKLNELNFSAISTALWKAGDPQFAALSTTMMTNVDSCKALRRKYDLILPAKCQEVIAKYITVMRLMSLVLAKSEEPDFRTKLDGLYAKKMALWELFIKLARKYLYTDRLSTEMVGMISGEVMDDAEIEKIVNERYRLHR